MALASDKEGVTVYRRTWIDAYFDFQFFVDEFSHWDMMTEGRSADCYHHTIVFSILQRRCVY